MKHNMMSSMVAVLLLSNPLYAAESAIVSKQVPAPVVNVQQEIEPAMILEKGMDEMLAFLGQQQQPDGDALMTFLDESIVPFFDFAYMAKSAAGPIYRHMDEQQRERMADNIRKQFLAAMVERLSGYQSQQVRVVSQRFGGRGNTATVSVAVLQPRGYPARLDFRFYNSKTGWRVFDVSANGQSAVIHYRRQFRKMMHTTRYERQGIENQYQRQLPSRY